jgi:hypothetical protein
LRPRCLLARRGVADVGDDVLPAGSPPLRNEQVEVSRLPRHAPGVQRMLPPITNASWRRCASFTSRSRRTIFVQRVPGRYVDARRRSAQPRWRSPPASGGLASSKFRFVRRPNRPAVGNSSWPNQALLPFAYLSMCPAVAQRPRSPPRIGTSPGFSKLERKRVRHHPPSRPAQGGAAADGALTVRVAAGLINRRRGPPPAPVQRR